MHRSVPTIALLIALVPTAALAKAAKQVPKPKALPPVRYVCEDGTRLSASSSPPNTTPSTVLLRILGTGKELTLTKAESADGARYIAGTTEFWDKGATGYGVRLLDRFVADTVEK